MFSFINVSNEPAQRQTPPKTRVVNTSIPKPVIRSERPRSGSPNGALQKDQLCERYTNTMYNRVPSPRGRFQTVVKVKERQPAEGGRPSAAKEQKGRPSARVQSPVPSPRSMPMKRSCSDVVGKRRPLDLECKPEVELKARPKTSQASRTTDSSLEHKVLNTVQNVLSHALLQQGKIDETNIKNILDSMRDSLYMDRRCDDEELSEIDVESKPSRTTVNEKFIREENLTEKKSKSVAGIVRRERSFLIPEKKPYRKIYDSVDSSSNKQSPEGDETFVCVDVPDLVFPDFPSSKKFHKLDEKLRQRQNDQSVSKQFLQTETTKQEGLMKQFEVGDSQTKDNHFWTSSEDAKLHEYIKNLIQNMKKDCENSVVETEGEIDSQGTICRSFCVCKVCVTKNTRSKTDSKQKMGETEKHSVENSEKPNNQGSTVHKYINEGKKAPLQRGAGNRFRLVKTPAKTTNADSPCKVIKNPTPNFKHESSLNTSLDDGLKKNSSYTVVDTGNHTEENDDMYLQRRMRKSPSRRPSAKIN